LTYAWRLRQLLAFNALRQRFLADILEFLAILFTFCSTLAATIYIYFSTAVVCGPDAISDISDVCHLSDNVFDVVLNLNLILPLLATVIRGISSSLNPLAKWGILKISAIKIESEIYCYRTKVGKYNPRKLNIASSSSAPTVSPSNAPANSGKKAEKDGESGGTANNVNPRKVFSAALDAIWTDLAASDISKVKMNNNNDNNNNIKKSI